MPRIHTTSLVLLAASVAFALPAAAEFPDWQTVAEVEVIEVVTRDDDGDVRETKVWFVLLDGEAYLRTNRSRWLTNLRRDPELELVIEGSRYEARAEEMPGAEIIERVDRASVEKYGWQERMIHPFRIRPPTILRLLPRSGGD